MKDLYKTSRSLPLRKAFDTVKENHGCAGVDGVGIEAFERDLRQKPRPVGVGACFRQLSAPAVDAKPCRQEIEKRRLKQYGIIQENLAAVSMHRPE